MKIGLSQGILPRIAPSLKAASSATISLPLDQVELSRAEPEWASSLIRHCSDLKSRQSLISALRCFPESLLQRIADYGTAIEVFAPEEKLPLYAHNLSKPQVAGSYSPRANVLCLPSHNLSPLVIFHELAHAFDLSLDEVSLSSDWKEAHAKASVTRQVVRPYATKDVGEYFAENLAAYHVPDLQLSGWLQQAQPQSGLTLEEMQKSHRHYAHQALFQVDPTAWKLVRELVERLPDLPAPRPRPALSEAEYRGQMQQLIEEKRQAQASVAPVTLLMQ